MSPDEIVEGLLQLSHKFDTHIKPNLLDNAVVLEACAFITEQMYRSQMRHPAQQTSNGDPVATYWNNVVSIKQRGL